MGNTRPTKLPSLVLSLYKNNIGLFLRIMFPVAFIAIILNISLFYYQVSRIEQFSPEIKKRAEHGPSQSDVKNLNQQENRVTAILNTNIGIIPISSNVYRLMTSDRLHNIWSPNGLETTGQSPIIWQIYPDPMIGKMNDLDAWTWSLNFKTIDYNPLILLLLTLCPLAIVVLQKLPDPQVGDMSSEMSSPTAQLVWKNTLDKIFKIIITTILFVLILEASQFLYALCVSVFPSFMKFIPKIMFLIILIPKLYFMVTLNLYNQCIIFENRSIIDIFKRSHSLVRGFRLKFLSIYLQTAWVAAVLSSVIMGSAFVILSLIFTELAPIRDVMNPLKFLSLFIGGNVAVMLPKTLSFLPTVLILIVQGIVSVLIIPFWAIVTTYLYKERLAMEPSQ